MIFFEIPIALILVFAFAAIGLGWSIISNIDKIVATIGAGLLGIIIAVILIVIIAAICNFIGRGKKSLTLTLLIATLCIFYYGIFTAVNYQYSRYDAFYTKTDLSLAGLDENGEIVYCFISNGSLISEVEKNTQVKMYHGVDSIPTTRNCIYIDENKTKITVEIEKSNMEKCGWVDCFGNLHEETE